MDVPRRQLNHEEVELLVSEWCQYHREIKEPLNVWLGWTVEELECWRLSAELPG